MLSSVDASLACSQKGNELESVTAYPSRHHQSLPFFQSNSIGCFSAKEHSNADQIKFIPRLFHKTPSTLQSKSISSNICLIHCLYLHFSFHKYQLFLKISFFIFTNVSFFLKSFQRQYPQSGLFQKQFSLPNSKMSVSELLAFSRHANVSLTLGRMKPTANFN